MHFWWLRRHYSCVSSTDWHHTCEYRPKTVEILHSVFLFFFLVSFFLSFYSLLKRKIIILKFACQRDNRHRTNTNLANQILFTIRFESNRAIDEINTNDTYIYDIPIFVYRYINETIHSHESTTHNRRKRRRKNKLKNVKSNTWQSTHFVRHAHINSFSHTRMHIEHWTWTHLLVFFLFFFCSLSFFPFYRCVDYKNVSKFC